MSQKKINVCGCKQCKQAKRRGLILGSRIQSFWRPEYGGYLKDMSVSDYVPFPKWQKGKRIRKPNKKEEFEYA